MSHRNHHRDRGTALVVCLLAVAPFLLTPWVHGDGIGSVSFLRSLVVGGDLDLSEELEYLSSHIAEDAGGLPGALLDASEYEPGLDPLLHTETRDPVTGRTPLFWAVGPPIIWSPAYLAAHLLVKLGNAAGLGHRSDGYGGLYYLAIALTTLACGIAGLLLIYRLVCSTVGRNDALWALLGVAWASPLLYYLYMAPTYSHAITILTAGAFFLYWWKNRGRSETGVWFRWGLLTGFLFVVRWNDAAVAVPAFVLEIVRYFNRESKAQGRLPLSGLAIRLAAALVGFLLVASIQFALWQYFHGRPLVRYPLSALGFWHEGLWGAFVSSRHGLFVWHPITLLASAGLLLLFRVNRELAGVCVATLALSVVSNCTIHDWWGGAAFGMRRLLSVSPVLAIGLASFFAEVRRAFGASTTRAGEAAGLSPRGSTSPPAEAGLPPGRLARWAAPAITATFSAWNVLLLMQYALGMISHTGAVTFVTIAANQPEALARAIRLLKGLIG